MAICLAFALIALDYANTVLRLPYLTHITLALVGFAAIVYLTDGNLLSLGLRLTPRQGWIWWVRMSFFFFGIYVFLGVGGTAVWYLFGLDLSIINVPAGALARYIQLAWFVVPVVEETFYRVILCVSIVSLFGRWKTIAVSGVLFGIMHVAWGVQGPANLVAGFFLAWAFLKSETVLIPILLHSAGNLLAFCSQEALWYLAYHHGLLERW